MNWFQKWRFGMFLYLSLALQLLLCAILFFLLFNLQVSSPYYLVAVASGIVLLSSALLLTALRYFFASHFNKTQTIMKQILGGDLKSRLPVRELNFMGIWFGLFNQMVEQLDENAQKLKSVEKSRQRWLQNLAHDLRTPLSTLCLSIESLRDESAHLSDESKLQLLNTGIHETHYMQDLVENLLILGLMEDPIYFSKKEKVNIPAIIDDTLAQMKAKLNTLGKSLDFKQAGQSLMLSINQNLAKRLIRNVVENALYYSRTRIFIECAEVDKKLNLIVTNDVATPLTVDEIEAFGKKRSAASDITVQREGPASLGLGAVIVREIVNKLQGTLTLQNLKDPRENTAQVQIVISFPVE